MRCSKIAQLAFCLLLPASAAHAETPPSEPGAEEAVDETTEEGSSGDSSGSEEGPASEEPAPAEEAPSDAAPEPMESPPTDVIMVSGDAPEAEVAPETTRENRRATPRRPTRERKREEFTLRPDIQLQTWFTAWDQDEDPQADAAGYGDPEHDVGFAIQRGRGGFSGRAGKIDYAFIVGSGAPSDAVQFGNTEMQIVDASGRYTTATQLGSAFVTVGVAKIPFAKDMLISSTDLTFQERTVGGIWMAPNRDVGVSAGTTWLLSDADGPQITIRSGVYNGNGNLFGDTDPGLLVAGRLEFNIGDTYRTWSYDRENAFGIGVAALSNAGLATATQGLTSDILGRLGPFTLLADLTYRSLTPTDATVTSPLVPRDTRQLGFSGQLSFFQPVERHGGIEAALRIASFDDALHLDDNGDVAIWHGGLTWRSVIPGVDIGTTFVHRIERNGLSVKNDTLRFTTQFRYPVPRR